MTEFLLDKFNADSLAKHATSYLMSKYREARYESTGIIHYKWSQSHEGCHDALSGQIFKFKEPPSINGTKANPGELAGCTCVAIGRIEGVDY
jgi:uncharacterized protein with gpF-like domain